MPFQSKFKSNDKLLKCAVNDQDHIGETTFPVADRQGPHVKLIQEALNTWAAKQKPAVAGVKTGESNPGMFGPDTARLVTLYKTRKNILNFQGKIDPIVGVKTVAALDRELPAAEDPSPTPPASSVMDVVVKFQGAFSTGVLTPDSVLSSNKIRIYKPMPDQPLGAELMVNPNNDRGLLRVGQKTKTIGAESTGVFVAVIAEILKAQALCKRAIGKIYIHGSSSGGRNAIDFAALMAGRGFRPHLVASVDAAFFQPDTNDRPEAQVDRPRTVPTFNVSAGSTPHKHNFFQTVGNHSKKTLISRVILFTSKMAGEEIHGNVQGFQNHDLSALIPQPLTISDDDAHGECGKLGKTEVERLIADDLLLKT